MKEKRRNKKKLTTLIALLMCVILAFGIAGSLAYYTSVSEKITNTFSYDTSDDEGEDGSSVSITLTETVSGNSESGTVIYGEEEYETGDDVVIELISGSAYGKQAEITVNEGSLDSYVYILVYDTLSSVAESNEYVTVATPDNSDWELVYTFNKYTLYRYGSYVSAGNSVTWSVDIDVDRSVTSAEQIEDVDGEVIVFYSYAIQAVGVSEETADKEAIAYYESKFGW